jgi:hypothetical protein
MHVCVYELLAVCMCVYVSYGVYAYINDVELMRVSKESMESMVKLFELLMVCMYT